MDGISDPEWGWRPAEIEAEISIRWRLEHITDLLAEPRNWTWLGLPVPEAQGAAGAARSAASACSSMAAAYELFRGSLSDGSVNFDAEVGPAAGPFASATRRSFVLHIADELIHHGAEAALLRDLYAAQSR